MDLDELTTFDVLPSRDDDGVWRIYLEAKLWNHLMALTPEQTFFIAAGIKHCCLQHDHFALRLGSGDKLSVFRSKDRIILKRGDTLTVLKFEHALFLADKLQTEASKLMQSAMDA